MGRPTCRGQIILVTFMYCCPSCMAPFNIDNAYWYGIASHVTLYSRPPPSQVKLSLLDQPATHNKHVPIPTQSRRQLPHPHLTGVITRGWSVVTMHVIPPSALNKIIFLNRSWLFQVLKPIQHYVKTSKYNVAQSNPFSHHQVESQ